MLGKPLPSRTNIIVTRNPDYAVPGAITAGSLEGAFAIAERENPKEIHIGGGAELYAAALPYVDRLHLTLVDSEGPADSYFPDFSQDFIPTKEHSLEESGNFTYQFVDYKRRID
jgi:dihydrofolate reductase